MLFTLLFILFVLFYSRLCLFTAESSPLLEFSNFLCSCICPHHSLLPHSVISPMTFWPSNLSYTLYQPFCASNGPSIIFHSGDVSSPFPSYWLLLDYVCYSDSLPDNGGTDSVFWLDILSFGLTFPCFFINACVIDHI